MFACLIDWFAKKKSRELTLKPGREQELAKSAFSAILYVSIGRASTPTLMIYFQLIIKP